MSGESIDCLVKRPKQYETYAATSPARSSPRSRWTRGRASCASCKMVSVNDCGIVVNPLTTQSQVIGGDDPGRLVGALREPLLDRNVGTMVNPNLEWYKVAGTSDMFEAQSILTPVANLGNNTSTAGIGEPPIVPTLAAVANAVFNATGARDPRAAAHAGPGPAGPVQLEG
jgi:hypothetical protein